MMQRCHHVFVMHRRVMSECVTHGCKCHVFVSWSAAHVMLMCFLSLAENIFIDRMMRDIVSMEENGSRTLIGFWKHTSNMPVPITLQILLNQACVLVYMALWGPKSGSAQQEPLLWGPKSPKFNNSF